MILASLRPDDINLPLFLHVLGAMALVGALIAASAALLIAWRGGGPGGDAVVLRRLAFRTMLLGVIPAYIVMRIGAEWTASEENLGDSDAAWLGIGYITADAGLLLVIAATLLAYVGVRRERRGGGGQGLMNTAAVIGVILVLAYLVALWAMASKPL